MSMTLTSAARKTRDGQVASKTVSDRFAAAAGPSVRKALGSDPVRRLSDREHQGGE